MIVDSDGRLLTFDLTPAGLSDNAGGQTMLEGICQRWPWVKHIFAGSACDRATLMGKAAFLDVSPWKPLKAPILRTEI